MNRIVLCLIGVVALTSCSKKFSLFSTNPDKFNLNNLEYEYLSLKSKIKYEDGDDKQKATANIRIRKDSVIWFSITPGLGIEAARGIITHDSIMIIDKINKEYTVKAVREFTDKVHFKLDLQLLESILVGNLIWPVREGDKITRSRGFYLIPKKYQTLSIKNYIGANSMKLEKMEVTSDTSINALQIQYSSFQLFDEKVVPTEVDMNIKYITPNDNTQKMSNITIEHAKVEIDKKHKFSFTIPKKYTRR